MGAFENTFVIHGICAQNTATYTSTLYNRYVTYTVHVNYKVQSIHSIYVVDPDEFIKLRS